MSSQLLALRRPRVNLSDVTRQRIERTAQRLLQTSPYGSLRTVECNFRDGVLTLGGKLPSYFLKQMAQVLLKSLEHVDQIVNRIEVQSPLDAQGSR